MPQGLPPLQHTRPDHQSVEDPANAIALLWPASFCTLRRRRQMKTAATWTFKQVNNSSRPPPHLDHDPDRCALARTPVRAEAQDEASLRERWHRDAERTVRASFSPAWRRAGTLLGRVQLTRLSRERPIDASLPNPASNLATERGHSDRDGSSTCIYGVGDPRVIRRTGSSTNSEGTSGPICSRSCSS